MRVRPLGPLLALLLLSLAGCSDDGGKGGEEAVFDDLDLKATSTTGVLRGIVVDDAVRPLGGAAVTVRQPAGPDLTATSSAAGAFAFDGLSAGTYFIQVTKGGYLGAQNSAEVVAGVAEPAIVKVLLARDASFKAPYFEQYVFEGYIECSTGAEHPQVGYLYLSACSSSPELFPNDRFAVEYILSGYPEWVQAEMSWESTQALSPWLSLAFHYDDPSEEDGIKDLDASGPSPILNTMDAATAKEYIEGLDHEAGGDLVLRERVFTVATDHTGPAATVQQRFTVYTTVFYGYAPPAGWTLGDTGEVPLPPA